MIYNEYINKLLIIPNLFSISVFHLHDNFIFHIHLLSNLFLLVHILVFIKTKSYRRDLLHNLSLFIMTNNMYWCFCQGLKVPPLVVSLTLNCYLYQLLQSCEPVFSVIAQNIMHTNFFSNPPPPSWHYQKEEKKGYTYIHIWENILM